MIEVTVSDLRGLIEHKADIRKSFDSFEALVMKVLLREMNPEDSLTSEQLSDRLIEFT